MYKKGKVNANKYELKVVTFLICLSKGDSL